jgi:hypothetical protein
MTEEELERLMSVIYANVFREMLLAEFKSDPEITPGYLTQPIKRQREIEKEISQLSEQMARVLVSKLKKEGYLTREPTEKKLESMIRETIKEFGVKK